MSKELGSLFIVREKGQSFLIGTPPNQIEITVDRISSTPSRRYVKMTCVAPKNVPIVRKETADGGAKQ